MKKSWMVLLGLIINLLLIVLVSAEVRINEVMHHTNNSFGFEWVELYNSNNEKVSLINWKIGDLTTNNKNFSLNISANGFGIIIDSEKENCLLLNTSFESCYALSQIGSGLNDGSEAVFIYNNNSFLVDNVSYNKNLKPFGGSFQFCSNGWLENNPTLGQQNNCSTTQIPPPQNNQSQPAQQPANSKISIKIEFDEKDFINGEEFKIKIKSYNLKSQTYNLKIWIKEEDKDTVISDRYGEDSGGKKVWKSGNYYIYNLFEGPGDKTETVKLRIREDNEDFSGDAEIWFKIEGVSESEDYEIIEILEKKEVVKKNITQEIKTTTKSTIPISGEVIKLGSLESKETSDNTDKNTANSNLIYESKNEKIKLYSIIGFAALCLGLIILLLFKRIK